MRENNGANAKYEAFISYRHQELDSAVAKTIHQQLETYRIPAYIKKRTGKAKMGKVFRDQDELPLLADLGEGIRHALETSEWLIVICSPDLLQSKWCMAEVEYFIQLGKQDRILTVLVAGEPEESFPPQLRFIKDAAGETLEREPLAADVRATSLAQTLAKVKREKLRLLAPMLGVGFDDLRRRHRERFLKLAVVSCLSVALFLSVFGGFSLYQSITIAQQNKELEEQRSKVYAGFSQEQLALDNRAGAALLALEALPKDMDTVSAAARHSLYDAAYRSYENAWPMMQASGGIESVLAPDGKTFVAADADYLRVYDTETFRLIYEHPGASTTIKAFESGDVSGAQVKRATYNKTGDTVFLPNGIPVFVNVRTGKVVKDGYFTDADELADFGLSRYECILPYSPSRYVIDLGTGETLFEAPTNNGTAKNLFSPDGKYYVVATYTGLGVFDIEQREVVNILLHDNEHVEQGYTFFSPDSRFLVVTRYHRETVLDGNTEEARQVYLIQVLEIPSCRVVYEHELWGYPNIDGITSSQSLPNFYHAFDSDIPELLFSPDSSKLILPVGISTFGVFDLVQEEMLFTRFSAVSFATFSPSGRLILTFRHRSNSWSLLDANNGDTIVSYFKSPQTVSRGYVLPDDSGVFIVGNNYCWLYQLQFENDKDNYRYFADDTNRYISPAAQGENAAVMSDRKDWDVVILEDSTQYIEAKSFVSAGDVIVGYLMTPGGEFTSWDAVTGKFISSFAVDGYVLSGYKGEVLQIFPDGSRVVVLYHRPEVSNGGFQTFDTRTGELLAQTKDLWLSDATILFSRDVTKVVYIYDNVVKVFDTITGKELFVLDDYPQGQLALGIWSGHRAAISDDGSLIAIAHSKRGTLEIIDSATGERLHDILLNENATTTPCFSHDGRQVVIGLGKYLLAVDVKSGKTLFSFYDEDGFETDYHYSQDDNYLLGVDIRNAATGESICPVSLKTRPEWEITETAGIQIPVGNGCAIYVPSIKEAVADLNGHLREYEFTAQDKQKFVLD